MLISSKIDSPTVVNGAYERTAPSAIKIKHNISIIKILVPEQ